MPFPKGTQKGKDRGEQQQADLSVCGLCSGSFAEDEERIEARCSACGTRAFHPVCVTDHMDKEIRTLVKDKRQQERGRLWARNHPDQIFCRNGHIKHIPACPQAGCSGSMEAAELVKPRKPAQEEEPPNAPPPPAQQQKGPKPKAKQPKAATQAGQAAAAGLGVPRKAVASSLKASAAPHAQLGGSASLSRATSNLSQSSAASSTPTFAQQQLAEARAAAAAARAQLAAARGGHGSGSLGAAAARSGSAAGSRASGAGQQLARLGSVASAASSSVWAGASSAALEADEGSEEEEQQPEPPPRAPTPDFSQVAWPELGPGAPPAARGSSSSRAAASWAQQADEGDAGDSIGGAEAFTPEQQEGYLEMLAAMEAEEQHWHERREQQQQQQQQQQQLPAREPSPQPGWDAQHAQQPDWDAQQAQQPGWDAQHVQPLPPAVAAAATAVEAAAAPRSAAQPAGFEEEWEHAEEGEVDVASLAALLRQQQQAFQRQLAAGQSGWEQPAAGQAGAQVSAPVPQPARSLWEQPTSSAAAAAAAAPAQQAHSLWDAPAAAAAQPAPLLPPAPAPAAPAWDGLGAAAAALMPDEWMQAATAATFAGYAVQSAKVAQAHLGAVQPAQQEQPQPAVWERPAGQPVDWAQPAAAAAFAGYNVQPSAHVPARFAGTAVDSADYGAAPPAETMPADGAHLAAAAAAAAPAYLGAAAAAAPAEPQQPDPQAEVDELMQLLGIA